LNGFTEKLRYFSTRAHREHLRANSIYSGLISEPKIVEVRLNFLFAQSWSDLDARRQRARSKLAMCSVAKSSLMMFRPPRIIEQGLNVAVLPERVSSSR
jgi:hypothetical protein